MPIAIDRLERLATLLDTYQERRGQPEFDLYEWGRLSTRRGGFLWLQTVECGTAACAVGLACLSGEFAGDGLTFVRVPNGYMRLIFKDHVNWEAVQAFFGLSAKQATKLFLEASYPISRGPAAAKAVAARIRETIARSQRGRNKLAAPAIRTQEAVERIKAAALEPASA